MRRKDRPTKLPYRDYQRFRICNKRPARSCLKCGARAGTRKRLLRIDHVGYGKAKISLKRSFQRKGRQFIDRETGTNLGNFFSSDVTQFTSPQSSYLYDQG